MSFKTYTLGEIASNTSRRFNFNNREQVCFVNTGDILDGHFLVDEKVSSIGLPGQAKKAIQKGDILYSEIRPGNKRHLLVKTDVDDYVVSTKFMVITCNQDIVVPEYLYLVLTSKECEAEFKVIADSRSGTFPQITFDAVAYYPIELPSLVQQRAVVEFIKSITGKLNLNKLTNQTLEQMAQAIFKSWFVDFDPVKVKMNGEQPEGMDAATASLFPEKLVESELGLIPEGWSASSMGEHFNITMGQSPKGETYNEEGEGIAFFQGRRDFGFRYPDVRVYTTDPKRFAKAGDTLISVRAPVGDKNMAAIDCCIGRGVAAIKHKSDSRSFTYAFMSHIEKKLGDSGSSGTVFSSINQKELKKVSFVAPPQKLIEAFHKIVDPIDQKVEVLSKEIESLSSLRDTLLPKLLSGEIELDTQ